MKSISMILLTIGCLLVTQSVKGANKVKQGVNKNQAFPINYFPTIDGDMASLADFRGKKTILIHFASW